MSLLKWSEPDAAAAALQQRAPAPVTTCLLAKAASDRGILHLMLAHHADDQAETVLLRLAKGSGPDGLSGMSAIRHDAPARLLRPLLGVSPGGCRLPAGPRNRIGSRIHRTCLDRFARPRLRASCRRAGGGPEDGYIWQCCRLLSAQARAAIRLERGTALILARHARILPQGFAELALAGWQAVDIELRRRVLASTASDNRRRRLPSDG